MAVVNAHLHLTMWCSYFWIVESKLIFYLNQSPQGFHPAGLTLPLQ